ncbi:hypothetical protein HY478_02485 [Candidatus Uhrbacteria bacterium]|nr:hypothetical protein [Candidatus Uhrbacteria bacterium]
MDDLTHFAGEQHRTPRRSTKEKSLWPWTPRAVTISLLIGLLAWSVATPCAWATLPHHIVHAQMWTSLCTSEIVAVLLTPLALPHHWRVPHAYD